MCVCVRACVRACVCVHAWCMRACMREGERKRDMNSNKDIEHMVQAGSFMTREHYNRDV